ncbi:hypothetical protein PTTG_07792 [Puccinia triticina 1-1 BBBD Race 1]|uniref:Ketoreductase domain-containing protein n=2 Tax=Puccinia triticina TaxID=208348 RepID=A0A180G9V8_PUCT1|nr:uncharacterized protein PtA15_6A459 [Puccinia triticina]OAV88703.1 hypothetical protein PTTG_07792 [Puccinia triticina 1-1 BBBD Race 1]WAQ85830.1 hypothetical protein PtA15_6A459 [Puccinia triticina]WAR55717.1 hypothetical protein PtB15_6B460 [Puccinia triticina]
MEIKNQIFFVTGGCSGLGLAVTYELLELHGLVCVLDRDEEQGNNLEKKHDGRLLFQKADVRSELEIHTGIKKAIETWPERTIGGLVHCAGIGAGGKVVGSRGQAGSLEIFKSVIDINLTGSFNVARLVASEIVSQSLPINNSKTGQKAKDDQGVIILTSSTSYQDGQVGQVGYAASKGGVASMILPMARDLARFGIRVNAIAPSLFDTKMGKSVSPAVKENLLKTLEYPLRFGDPREFSSLVVECIRNTYLNGTVIRLDAAGRMGKI